MAHRLIHRQLPQEVRFPNRPTAEQYAINFGGGLANWNIIVVASHQVTSHPVTRSGGG